MELSVLSNGNASSKVTVSDQCFDRAFNEGLIHQVVTAYMAAGRQGTRAQKTRSEVSGGGIKPWRQKGTGRARSGSSRSPIWRKGGVTFAAKPTSYAQKVNKKAYRAAISSILSELIRIERLVVVEKISVAEPKTKLLLKQLQEMSLGRTLILIKDEDMNLALSARNVQDVAVSQTSELSPVELVAYDHVVVTVDALKELEAMLGGSSNE